MQLVPCMDLIGHCWRPKTCMIMRILASHCLRVSSSSWASLMQRTQNFMLGVVHTHTWTSNAVLLVSFCHWRKSVDADCRCCNFEEFGYFGIFSVTALFFPKKMVDRISIFSVVDRIIKILTVWSDFSVVKILRRRPYRQNSDRTVRFLNVWYSEAGNRTVRFLNVWCSEAGNRPPG